MKVTLLLHLEQIFADRPQDAAAGLKDIVQAAEAAGFDACNVTDHPAPAVDWLQLRGHDAFDPFCALSFAAAATSRILLHTNLVVLPYRNPFITAKAAATLDVLSGGRLILGVGTGYLAGEFAALGADHKSRGKDADEAIEVLKLAWSGEPVVYKGRTFDAAGNLPRPRPLQRPHPRIWCGGNSKAAIRRAALRCDGWTPFFTPPGPSASHLADALVTIEDLGARLDLLRELRAEAGRDGPFDICPTSPVQLSDRSADLAEQFIEGARRMSDLGANWMCSGVPGKGASEFVESVHWFGEEVLPHLR